MSSPSYQSTGGFATMRSLFGGKKESEKKEERNENLVVFGTPLSDVCEAENLPIPTVAEEVISYLEERAIDLEGLFRIPGNVQYVEQLKAYYNGEPSEITLENCDDRHAVACLLKLYLRELPDPLLTHNFYNTFIAVQKNQDFEYRMTNLRKLINALPKCHKNLLTRLLAFLIKVAAFSEKNKMTEANLAIVFGPNLLRPSSESVLRMIEDARHVNGVTLSLLEEFEYLVTCTASHPQHRPTELELPPPELEITFSPRAPNSGDSRRRAYKFNVKELEGFDSNNEITETESPDANSGDTTELSSPKLLLKKVARDFDLSNPVQFITKQLKEDAVKKNRPQELEDMSISEKQDEKQFVKTQLRAFDFAFQKKHGRQPSKVDKEPLRPIYQRYRDLTKSIQAHKEEKEEEETYDNGNGNHLESNEKYIALKKEKKRLQYFLHQYQCEFIQKNGRKVQYVQDRLPVQEEYNQYKEIKAKIRTMEETYSLLNEIHRQ